MTRKDYQLISDVLRASKTRNSPEWLDITFSMANALQEANRAFNKQLFYVNAGCSMETMDKLKEEWLSQ